MTNVIGTDVSFYQDESSTTRQIDFAAMKSHAGFVIIRAGQNIWVDPDFAWNWQHAKEVGLARGSYWFYDSRVSPVSQANLWYAQFKGDMGELPLWADFEENYGGAYKGWKNFQLFLERIKSLAPTSEIGIYTGYWYWKDNVVSVGGDLAYFHQFPLWIANYNAITPAVPLPWSANEWLFWQYTDKGNGATYGVESSTIDLNYFNGDEQKLAQRFNLNEPPVNTDVFMDTHKGVRVYKLSRYGTMCYVHVIDPILAAVEISNCGFRTPLQAQEIYGSQITSNGGGWPSVQDVDHRSNEMWVSNGKIMQGIIYIKDNRPYINISKSNVVTVSQNAKPMPDLYNAVGFDRILLWNGVYNYAITENWKDARTGMGVTAGGKIVLLSVEGNDRLGTGFTFYEMASVMLEFGVVNGGNNDGGSSTCVRNTAVSLSPLFAGSDGNEAFVINHIMVFAEPLGSTSPNEDTMTIPTIKAVARLATNIKTMSGVPSGVIATIPIGGWCYGDDSATDVLRLRNSAGTQYGFYRPTGEFVPLTYECKASKTNLTVTPYAETPVDPPPIPPTNNVEVIVSIVNDVVTVKVDGIAYVKQ